MVAVVIPSYRVKSHILSVIRSIPEIVTSILIIDDGCPEKTGKYVLENTKDPRVKVFFHETNQGVGAAVVTGYREALKDRHIKVVVKVDGDSQMDPALIPHFIDPILEGHADYSKGNRFFEMRLLTQMPWTRLLGNIVLSFWSKLSTGYWNLMDPTNGFVAIHVRCLQMLPLAKLAKDYFFETDLLFRLYTIRARVQEIPMVAKYGKEESSMSLARVIFTFPYRHSLCLIKRIFYSYFLRDFNIFTILLLSGLALVIYGLGFGFLQWYLSSFEGIFRSSGTVMLAGLPVIIGMQFILSALIYDVQNVPNTSIHVFVKDLGI